MLNKKASLRERKGEAGQKGLGLSRRPLLTGAAGVDAVTAIGPVLAQEESVPDTVRQHYRPFDRRDTYPYR